MNSTIKTVYQGKYLLRALMTACTLSLVLAGCGQKGALVLSEESSSQSTQSTTPKLETQPSDRTQ